MALKMLGLRSLYQALGPNSQSLPQNANIPRARNAARPNQIWDRFVQHVRTPRERNHSRMEPAGMNLPFLVLLLSQLCPPDVRPFFSSPLDTGKWPRTEHIKGAV